LEKGKENSTPKLPNINKSIEFKPYGNLIEKKEMDENTQHKRNESMHKENTEDLVSLGQITSVNESIINVK